MCVRSHEKVVVEGGQHGEPLTEDHVHDAVRIIGLLSGRTHRVITAMALFRRLFRLERHITADHFKKLGLLLLVLGLVYFYFTVNGYIGTAYVPERVETTLLHSIFMGSYALQFWSMVAIGLMLGPTVGGFLVGFSSWHAIPACSAWASASFPCGEKSTLAAVASRGKPGPLAR